LNTEIDYLGVGLTPGGGESTLGIENRLPCDACRFPIRPADLSSPVPAVIEASL
jgi:hypothetical protein